MYYATCVRTSSFGLLIRPSDQLTITAFSDSDWTSNIHDRCSIAAHCVYLGDTLVSWSSKKQIVVARLSTESKYRVLAHAAAEVTWLRQLLLEIGFSPMATSIIWGWSFSSKSGVLFSN